jgi:hypothetical protein
MSANPPQAPILIVEDGTNVPNSNTYISLADAVTYFTNMGNLTFTNASPINQSTALVRAASGMSSWLNGRWYGRRANSAYAGGTDGGQGGQFGTSPNSTPQSMDWPRCGVRDSDGYLIPNNIVPQKVVNAQCLIAAIELTTPFIQQQVNAYNSLASEKVGPIDVAFKPTAPSVTYWPQVIAMLRDFASIGVMPIEVVIGLSRSEEAARRRDRHGFGMNPFDFPDYFHLIKEPIYNPDLSPGWYDDDNLIC